MKTEEALVSPRKFGSSMKKPIGVLGKSPRGRRNQKDGKRGISQTAHKEANTSKIRFKLDPETGEIDEANFEKEEMFMNF